MDAASHEVWPVRRLTEVSAVSAAHFAHAFKQAFDVPPHRYLLTRRIERAISLLLDTDLPVTEVALRTGWNSLGSFGRVIHDVIGTSPGRFCARAHVVPHGRAQVPRRVVHAAHRPDLRIAVLEKRQRGCAGTTGLQSTEVP